MGISQHPLKLALLECDTPVPVVKANHGTYLPIFLDFLRSSLPPSSRDLQFTLEGFDVVTAQEYPDLDNGEYKGVLISGSKYSAYDDDSWIRKLVDWVAETVERRPDVKIIGKRLSYSWQDNLNLKCGTRYMLWTSDRCTGYGRTVYSE